jgi:hypothetical protein
MTKTISIGWKRYEMLREAGGLQASTFYTFPDGQAAYSPDGSGLYWYETLAEAKASHA